MRSKLAASILAATIALVSLGNTALADPPRWTFMDLGAIFNSVEAIPTYSVNDLGQVAGAGVQGAFGGSPRGPFLTQPYSQVNWSPRPADPPINPDLFVDQIVNGMYNNAPWNPNTDQTLRPSPFAVNNNGVTTGVGASYPHAMAFLGTTSQTTAIGPTGAVCVGYAINDANVVAGVITDPGHAIRIAGGVMTDLGTLRTQPPNAYNDISYAYGINQSGTIVGSAKNDVPAQGVIDNELRAYRWTQGTGMQDLGNLGGPRAEAYDINIGGQVTGYVMDDQFNRYAAVWSPTNVITVIPTFGPGYTNLHGRWITDAGWVVGPAYGARYFLYYNGQTYDLATLLDDDGTHWSDIVITGMSKVGHLTGYGVNDNTPGGARRAFLLIPGGPTPTALALVSAEVTPEGVQLRWHSPATNLRAMLQRRGENEAWSDLADVLSDGTGMVAYDDATVLPGHRYGYRLEIAGAGPTEYLGEAWVDVPAGSALAINGFLQNPSPGNPTVSFALPHAGPARLEVLDVMGRRVATQEWASLEGGAHTIPLRTRMSPGVYVMRLTFAERTVSAKGMILGR